MRTSRNYLLALLTVIVVFNYVDRVALGLMLQDIKVDLALTDTQLGLLTGIAFALFYAVMGIPIARWADRGNRVTIIALTTGLWSIAVALCGAAASFAQLLLIRVGVAVGEAGCHPPAFSLISQYFSRAERPQAVARYMLGWPLALLFGFFGGGWLNQLYGWRTTFIILGLPGLALAALAALTIKEPRRIAVEVTDSSLPRPDLKEAFVTLWGNVTFRRLLFSFSLSYFFGNGIMQWLPAFFTRSHGLESGEIGTWFAAIYGLGGLLGTWLGGEWASRFAVQNERLQLLFMAITGAFVSLVWITVYVMPGPYSALAVLSLASIAGAASNGPGFAATQTLVPPHLRALSIALILFFCNLIGLGFGPLTAGALSDALRPWFGEESLRYALLILSPGNFVCTWLLWRASRSVVRDVAAAQAGSLQEIS